MSVACPVCGQEFDNEQGRGGHLASVKDAAHLAYRAEPSAQPSPPSPEPSPEPTRQPSAEPPSPAGPAEPSPGLSPGAQPLAPSSRAQEDEPSLGFFPVSFEPLASIQPLAASPDPENPAGAAPGSPQPSAVRVPLEPILAGTTMAALNGLLLNRPVDAPVTLDEVRATGFPTAGEACLRHYFPDLPLDHPVTALLLSGANLAMLVAEHRGRYERQPRQPDKPDGQPPAPAAPAPPPPADAAAAVREGPAGSTGDPYWDALLAKAGGVAL